MASAKPALGVGLVAPRDASAYFASKKALLPSYNWDDVYAHEHAAGLAVAGITQRDVLQLFADELQRTIDAGGDLRDFKRRVQPALVKAGYWGNVEVTDPATGDKRITKFNPSRLELIFNTNVRQAQTAGQYQRALAAKADFPYLVYLSRGDGNVRPLHKAWHGTVLPVEHAFWQTHLPPCGWNCRCRFMSVTESDIERFAKRGVPIKREPPQGWGELVPYTRKGTGEAVMVPRGIDPGFDHNPATSRLRGVVPQMRTDGHGKPVLESMLRNYDLPAPTVVAASEARTPAGIAKPGEDVSQALVRWVLGHFGADIGRPTVYTGPAGLAQVMDENLFSVRDDKGQIIESKALKRQRGDWLPLIIKTLQDPDQVRTLFPRDAKLNMRVRMLRQFVVQSEQQEVSVLVVWEYDKSDLVVDVLVGKSAYINDPITPEKAAQMRKEFLQGDLLLYDRRAGIVKPLPPQKENPGSPPTNPG